MSSPAWSNDLPPGTVLTIVGMMYGSLALVRREGAFDPEDRSVWDKIRWAVQDIEEWFSPDSDNFAPPGIDTVEERVMRTTEYLEVSVSIVACLCFRADWARTNRENTVENLIYRISRLSSFMEEFIEMEENSNQASVTVVD